MLLLNDWYQLHFYSKFCGRVLMGDNFFFLLFTTVHKDKNLNTLPQCRSIQDFFVTLSWKISKNNWNILQHERRIQKYLKSSRYKVFKEFGIRCNKMACCVFQTIMSNFGINYSYILKQHPNLVSVCCCLLPLCFIILDRFSVVICLYW